jgi:K+ transporter
MTQGTSESIRPSRRTRGIDLSDVTYYVGHETVVDSDERLPRWLEALFAAMQRNSTHVSDLLQAPERCGSLRSAESSQSDVERL